ncbi:MAG: amylo-alpha-1,6-glucosidase, partial [Moorella sp. (in: Bacteria)]|nr:amylo-alpha-1,6-glucosidase [Moorella sp. (in: firmicutes)]
CRSARGLVNQGWKDSWDGVIDLEGNIPRGPIALVEVQAYYYLALSRAAEMFRALGEERAAEEAEAKARKLQEKFLKAFWLDEEEFVAFALDGDKKPIKTPVSNAGHCLFTGILPAEKARAVARRLFKPDMYSGWGIRTMSKSVKPYNPMSYHNGSVWPHDNAIVAYGLRTLNLFNLLEQVITNLFEAAMYFPYHRLPEVFCGFTRRAEGGPVLYPTACNPQAWA